jgi:tetratricopeptide (TPR) repeat protein
VGVAVARKRARIALVVGAVLTVAGGVAVNRVGGSWLQQVAVFAVACVLFVLAALVAGWGTSGTKLRLRTADARGRPRQLGDLELGDLGVHWSRATADGYGPYVAREADRELNEAISGGQTLVAVFGTVLAGRTRTLAEAAQRHLPDAWLVWFEEMPGTRLSDMVDEARHLARGGPVVLWLENADLVVLSQFSDGLLDELPPGFRVLMTLDEALIDSGVLPADAARVLSTPKACARLGLITAEERERLLAQPAYAQIAAVNADEPLMGRLMVSLDRVIDALETSDEESICRVAVLHAAVDWQRAAVPKPLTGKVIEELYHGGFWRELARRGPNSAVSRTQFRQAIKSLLAPAPRHGPQLLDEVYSGRVTHLRPHPLLATVADNPRRPPGWAISETLWNYLAKTLDDPQLLKVGLNAFSRGDHAHARRLLGSLDVVTIPAEIIFTIATDAYHAGQTTAARTWFAKAIESDHPDYAPWAMIVLGVLESVPGHIEEARKWFTKAIETGHADFAPGAMVNLGKLEKEQGRIQEARSWYTKAIKSGHADAAPAAMFGLGVLEEEQGRIEEARKWYTEAVESGHADNAPKAMLSLGNLEKEQGRIDEARKWYAKAIESGHADAAPTAMGNLGNLETEQGRIDEARKWYAKAIETSHADAAPAAMFDLADLEKKQDRIEEARNWYTKAIASDHPDYAPKAMNNLGLLERYQGHLEEARALFNHAISTGHADAAPAVMFNLGALDHQQGRIKEARDWYTKVLASRSAEWAPAAMFGLGMLEQGQGRIQEARTWYGKTLAGGQPDWASRAQAQLDQLRRHLEDIQRAETFAKYGSPHIGADNDQQPAAAEPTPGSPEETGPG